ncbi:MAG: hypothetical protein SVS85_00460 [Candidatus Nanohaloarchaea archaeon]|nr:hypothetical protein [Candidatus Nanohaloarchaea archaeon]
MKRILAFAALLLLFSGVVSAQTDALEGSVKTLRCEGGACRVGENSTLNVTLLNPLPISDTMMVRFEGEALDLLKFHFPENMNCEEGRNLNLCRGISVPPNTEEKFSITLEATSTSFGRQETLEATVNSTTTQLSSTDRIAVRVEPYFAPVTVSAPGIQDLQVAVLAVLGALTAGFLFRR